MRSVQDQRNERNEHPVALLRTSPTFAATDLETRVNILEKELEILKKQVAAMSISKLKQFKGPAFRLEPHQASNIGNFVRTEMFRAIKFLDASTMRSQGDMIFQRALKAAKIEDQGNNQEARNIVISKVKHYLNVRKGHVIRDFRCAALGKYNNQQICNAISSKQHDLTLAFVHVILKFNITKMAEKNTRSIGTILLIFFALVISTITMMMCTAHGSSFANSCLLKSSRLGKIK
jgi:membrane-associated HD superfamily phosphohydrolase